MDTYQGDSSSGSARIWTLLSRSVLTMLGVVGRVGDEALVIRCDAVDAVSLDFDSLDLARKWPS